MLAKKTCLKIGKHTLNMQVSSITAEAGLFRMPQRLKLMLFTAGSITFKGTIFIFTSSLFIRGIECDGFADLNSIHRVQLWSVTNSAAMWSGKLAMITLSPVIGQSGPDRCDVYFCICETRLSR